MKWKEWIDRLQTPCWILGKPFLFHIRPSADTGWTTAADIALCNFILLHVWSRGFGSKQEERAILSPHGCLPENNLKKKNEKEKGDVWEEMFVCKYLFGYPNSYKKKKGLEFKIQKRYVILYSIWFSLYSEKVFILFHVISMCKDGSFKTKSIKKRDGKAFSVLCEGWWY